MTLDKIRGLDKDELLGMLGLETRHTTADYLIPALALFGTGLAVGVGIGLILAPRPGRELRADIVNGLQHAPEALSRLPQRASDAVHRVSEQLRETT